MISHNENIDITNKNYVKLLQEAKQKIISTRIKIAKSVSREQFELYWWLGQSIVEAQEKYGWGRSIVEQLAKDLQAIFPNTTHGFSARNLWDRYHSLRTTGSF